MKKILLPCNRYYSPTLGRFLTRDPIGIAGGDVNWYCYCGNDPVNFVDDDGLMSWSEWCRKFDAFLDRWSRNYEGFLKTEGPMLGLEYSDMIAPFSVAGLAMDRGNSLWERIIMPLAEGQVRDAVTAGAFCKGTIPEKILVAEMAAKNATRTAFLSTVYNSLSKASGAMTFASIGYSLGVRAGLSIKAAFMSLGGK